MRPAVRYKASLVRPPPPQQLTEFLRLRALLILLIPPFPPLPHARHALLRHPRPRRRRLRRQPLPQADRLPPLLAALSRQRGLWLLRPLRRQLPLPLRGLHQLHHFLHPHRLLRRRAPDRRVRRAGRLLVCRRDPQQRTRRVPDRARLQRRDLGGALRIHHPQLRRIARRERARGARRRRRRSVRALDASSSSHPLPFGFPPPLTRPPGASQSPTLPGEHEPWPALNLYSSLFAALPTPCGPPPPSPAQLRCCCCYLVYIPPHARLGPGPRSWFWFVRVAWSGSHITPSSTQYTFGRFLSFAAV